MNKWAFINDQFIPEEKAFLHYRDLAIQRGYGIFDFLKFINGKPVFLEDHLNRLFASAKEMRLFINQGHEELKEIIFTLVKKNQAANAGVRISITGGYSEDGYQLSSPNLIISEHEFQSPSKVQFERGIKLISFPHQRQLPQIKTIDYLMAVWLQPVIREQSADDVLYHNDGMITECPRSNFFIITEDEKLLTPKQHILKGITRMKVLEFAKSELEVEERDITLGDIRNAREAFITSTTKMILPVSQIDKHRFTTPKIFSTRLSEKLNELIRNESGALIG